MRPRTVLVLFVMVAALAAFIWFVERDLPSSDRRAELEKRVVAVQPDEVDAVEIEWLENRVVLEREPAAESGIAGGGEVLPPSIWMLRQPHGQRADEIAVDRLIAALVELESVRRLDEVEPEALGLAEPRAQVTLRAGNDEIRLLLGARIPAAEEMVVAVEGKGGAYVVSTAIWADLTRRPGEWRSKDLFHDSRGSIERVTLAAGGQRLALVRQGDRFWIEGPVTDLGDADLVGGLLSDIEGLRAEEFLEDLPAAAGEVGLDPATVAIEVVQRGREKPFRVEIGSLAGGDDARRFARVDGRLVILGDELVEHAEREAEKWRSLAWSSLEVYQVERVAVERGDERLELDRDGADWKAGEERVTYTLVSDLLYALAGLEAERLVEPGAGEPELSGVAPVLTIDLAGDGVEESLALFPPVESGVPATVDGRQVVLLLGAGSVDDLQLKLGELRAELSASDGEGDFEADGGD